MSKEEVGNKVWIIRESNEEFWIEECVIEYFDNHDKDYAVKFSDKTHKSFEQVFYKLEEAKENLKSVLLFEIQETKDKLLNLSKNYDKLLEENDLELKKSGIIK